MRVANGVEMLELQVEFLGQSFQLNPTLIWDNETAILIDTGTPGQSEQIRTAMARAGVLLDKLKAVILTHQDIDHIGSLPEILQKSGGCGVEVYAHKLDKPYIEGELPLMKLNLESMAWQLEVLEEKERRHVVNSLLKNRPKTQVDKTVEDGQQLPFCGGIHVIHTPGHTPGHISLYLKRSKTLVVADGMFCTDGILQGIHRPSTPNTDEALNSLKKYVGLDVESLICYHGGICTNNVGDQLKELVRKGRAAVIG